MTLSWGIWAGAGAEASSPAIIESLRTVEQAAKQTRTLHRAFLPSRLARSKSSGFCQWLLLPRIEHPGGSPLTRITCSTCQTLAASLCFNEKRLRRWVRARWFSMRFASPRNRSTCREPSLAAFFGGPPVEVWRPSKNGPDLRKR